MADMKTYCRVFGYMVSIALHTGNLVYIKWTEDPELIQQDPKVEIFTKMQPRFFTVWTATLQVVHALIGLLWEYLVISNTEINFYNMRENLRWLKNVLFSAIVWPSTSFTFLTFWSIYTYDRSLVYEEYNDKVVFSMSNHILHTYIIISSLWELLFTPRMVPRSHRENIFIMTTYILVYLALVSFTYVQHGIWLYPIFAIYYGTIYFPIIHIAVMVIIYSCYFIQWPLTYILWSDVAKEKKIL